MNEPQCAHRTLEYSPDVHDQYTRDRWRCSGCKTEFLPRPMVESVAREALWLASVGRLEPATWALNRLQILPPEGSLELWRKARMMLTSIKAKEVKT